MLALAPDPEAPPDPVAEWLWERRRRSARERRRVVVLTEHLYSLVDELTEAVAPDDLICVRHGSGERRRPMVCPICALVEVRRRVRSA